jgi:hypothetical protein
MLSKKLEINKDCIVRDRPCGRVFGASNSCFVACPASDEVGFEIEIIKSVLLDDEIEPYIAVEHFEPARDIFCTKICTKIIESKLCIVLLSGVTNEDGYVIPNPNVYYEYGLMTAWKKEIIPVQSTTQKLSFNIKSLDTIKYTPADFKTNLSKAVQMKVATFGDSESFEKTNRLEDLLSLYFELNGLKPHKKAWTVDNTNYLPFELFNFGVIVYSDSEIDRLYFDTKLIVRRIERYIAVLDVKISGVKKSHDKANTDAQRQGTEKQLKKLEKQKTNASNPTFTIILLNSELKTVIDDRIKIDDISLTPAVKVVSFDELKEELRTL